MHREIEWSMGNNMVQAANQSDQDKLKWVELIFLELVSLMMANHFLLEMENWIRVSSPINRNLEIILEHLLGQI